VITFYHLFSLTSVAFLRNHTSCPKLRYDNDDGDDGDDEMVQTMMIMVMMMHRYKVRTHIIILQWSHDIRIRGKLCRYDSNNSFSNASN
jgi:hypothetical protein